MIPKIIHHIWIGPNKIPAKCINYINTWKKLHPNYEFIMWNNDNIPDLPENLKTQFERYGKKNKWAFQADVLRYYLVLKYGGIYVDVDFQCYKNIDNFLTKDFLIIFRDLNCHWIPNGLFGAVQGHPILENIAKNMTTEPYHGPIFFGRKIKEFLSIPIEKEYKSRLIYESAKNIGNIECILPQYVFSHRNKDKIAYHHALHSWRNKKS